MKKFWRHATWARILGLAAGFMIVPLTADELIKNGDFSNGTQNWSGDFEDTTQNSNPLDTSAAAGLSLQLREQRGTRFFQEFESGARQVQLTITYSLSTGGQYSGAGKVSEIATDIVEGKIAGTSYDPNNSTLTVNLNPNYKVYTSEFTTPIAILSNADRNFITKYSLTNDAEPGMTTVPPAPPPGANANGNPNQPVPVVPPSNVVQPNAPGNPGSATPVVPPSNAITPPAAPSATSHLDVPAGTPPASGYAPANASGSTTVTVTMSIEPHISYRLYFAFPPGQGTVTVTKVSLTEVGN